MPTKPSIGDDDDDIELLGTEPASSDDNEIEMLGMKPSSGSQPHDGRLQL